MTTTEYMQAAGRRLIWHADFQRAGDYLPAAVLEDAREWFALTLGARDLLVGFIPLDRATPELAGNLHTALASLYSQHPRRLACTLVLVASAAPSPGPAAGAGEPRPPAGAPAAINPAWEALAGLSGPRGATEALLLADLAAGRIHPLAGRPPKELPLRLLERFTPPDEEEMARAPARPRRRRSTRPAAGGTPTASYALITAMVAVWLLGELTGRAAALFNLGALQALLVLEGQWWRPVTYMLLHAGPAHLLFNAFATYWLGSAAEGVLGRGRYVILFLMSGVLAGLARVYLGQPLVVSVGASGAVFGIIGALAYAAYTETSAVRSAMLQSIGTLLLINLLFWFANRRIDLLVHAGGLVAGFLLAAAIGIPGRGSPQTRAAAGAALAVLVLLLTSLR